MDGLGGEDNEDLTSNDVKDEGDIITYKGKHINRLHPSGMFAFYSDSEERFIKSDELDYIKYLIDREEADELNSMPGI